MEPTDRRKPHPQTPQVLPLPQVLLVLLQVVLLVPQVVLLLREEKRRKKAKISEEREHRNLKVPRSRRRGARPDNPGARPARPGNTPPCVITASVEVTPLRSASQGELINGRRDYYGESLRRGSTQTPPPHHYQHILNQARLALHRSPSHSSSRFFLSTVLGATTKGVSGLLPPPPNTHSTYSHLSTSVEDTLKPSTPLQHGATSTVPPTIKNYLRQCPRSPNKHRRPNPQLCPAT